MSASTSYNIGSDPLMSEYAILRSRAEEILGNNLLLSDECATLKRQAEKILGNNLLMSDEYATLKRQSEEILCDSKKSLKSPSLCDRIKVFCPSIPRDGIIALSIGALFVAYIALNIAFTR